MKKILFPIILLMLMTLMIACASADIVILPKNTVSIEDEAFMGNAEITAVYVPPTVHSFGVDVFKGCSENLVMYGTAGSPAETYANNNSIRFVPWGTGSEPSVEEVYESGITTVFETVDTVISGMNNHPASYSEVQDNLDHIEASIKELMESGHINSYERTSDSIVFRTSYELTIVYSPALDGIALNGQDGDVGSSNKVTYLSYQPYAASQDFDEFHYVGRDILNGNVTAQSLSEMQSNSLIWWNGHGGYSNSLGPYLRLGETFELSKFIYSSSYRNEFSTDRLVVQAPSSNLCATYAYIEKHCGNLDNSVILLGACYSMKDLRLAQAFISKGAGAVIGFSDEVVVGYEENFNNEAFWNLHRINESTENFYTVNEAFEKAKIDECGSDKAWAFKTVSQLSPYSRDKFYNRNCIAYPRIKLKDDDFRVFNAVKLTFDEQNNGIIHTAIIEQNSTMGIIDHTPRSGFTFEEWNTKPDGSGETFNTNSIIVEPMTLYAIWKKLVTVSFNANGGNCEAESTIVKEGTALGTLPSATKEHYSFAGWNTASDGSGESVLPDTIIQSDLTVFAQWKDIERIELSQYLGEPIVESIEQIGGTFSHEFATTPYESDYVYSNNEVEILGDEKRKNIIQIKIFGGETYTLWGVHLGMTEEELVSAIQKAGQTTDYSSGNGWSSYEYNHLFADEGYEVYFSFTVRNGKVASMECYWFSYAAWANEYLRVLNEKSSSIRRFENKDSTSSSVCFIDLSGDDIPEMIFMSAELYGNEEYSDPEGFINIYTYHDGKAKKLLSELITWYGGNGYFYHISASNSGELYVQGDEPTLHISNLTDSIYCAFEVFTISDGQLSRDDLYYITYEDWTDEPIGETYYHWNSVVSASEYAAAYRSYNGKMERNLLASGGNGSYSVSTAKKYLTALLERNRGESN